MSKSRIDRNVLDKLADALEAEYQECRGWEIFDSGRKDPYFTGKVVALGWAKRLLQDTALDALALPKEVCEWAQGMAKQMGATHWIWSRNGHEWIRFYVLPPDDTDTIYTHYILYESDGIVKDDKPSDDALFQYRTYFGFSRGNGLKTDLLEDTLMPITASLWEYQRELLGKK